MNRRHLFRLGLAAIGSIVSAPIAKLLPKQEIYWIVDYDKRAIAQCYSLPGQVLVSHYNCVCIYGNNVPDFKDVRFVLGRSDQFCNI